MKPGIAIVVAALGIGGAIFVSFASSPWLTWHSRPLGNHHFFIFSKAVPQSLAGETAEYFTTWPARWVYVYQHSSWQAWGRALRSLALERVPVKPAALLSTTTWFDEPVTLMATAFGASVRVVAITENAEAAPFSRSDVDSSGETGSFLLTPLQHPTLVLDIPGTALGMLPTRLTESWNDLLRQRLDLTATRPDILAALAQYSHVLVTISDPGVSVGIMSRDSDERARWQALREAWAVDEDRFRRPVNQAFRLPDGTLGREKVAGLPGQVWGTQQSGVCRSPLPEKPALWACDIDAASVLASYAWQPDRPTVSDGSHWEMRLGEEFLKVLPEVTAIVIHGEASRASAVIELAP